MFRKILSLAIIMVSIGICAFSVAAYADCPICAKASSSNTNWPERSACQLTQGFGNLFLGWTQIFTEPVQENVCSSNPCPVYKTTNGLLLGCSKAIITSGSGLMEILTCWTPARIIPDSGCVGCAKDKQKASCDTANSYEKKAQA